MAENRLSQQDIDQMIQHWLNTPVGTYLGSDYGFDKYALLFNPLSMSGADEMIAKLKRDIPLLALLDADAINFYKFDVPPDKVVIFLQVGDSQFNIV